MHATKPTKLCPGGSDCPRGWPPHVLNSPDEVDAHNKSDPIFVDGDRRRSKKLPTLRRGVTYSPEILASKGEPIRVYVRVNRHENRIIELFVDVDLREGSAVVEMAKAVGRITSHALRAGADIESLIDDLMGTAGGPEGAVRRCDGITYALSVADLVGQVLRVAWKEEADV